MHRHALLIACQRQDGWTLGARQQGNHFIQTLGWGVHHDVFGFTRLNHALNTGQQLVDQLLLSVGHLAVTLDQARFGAVDHLHFAQTVRFQRRAGRHQVTDGVRQTRTRRHFYRTVQQTGFKLHAFLIQIAL